MYLVLFALAYVLLAVFTGSGIYQVFSDQRLVLSFAVYYVVLL